MPWINFAGWLLTGSVVAFAMLLIVPPSRIAGRVSPASLPIVVYAVNAIMPLAMVARAGLWWSFWPGLVGMGLVVVLALRARRDPGREMREAPMRLSVAPNAAD
jgi:uncharacterized membrane protein